MCATHEHQGETYAAVLLSQLCEANFCVKSNGASGRAQTTGPGSVGTQPAPSTLSFAQQLDEASRKLKKAPTKEELEKANPTPKTLSFAELIAEQGKQLKPIPTKAELAKEALAAENEKKDRLKQQAQTTPQVKLSNMEAMSQQIDARKKAFGSGKNVSRYSDSDLIIRSDDEASDSSDYQF